MRVLRAARMFDGVQSRSIDRPLIAIGDGRIVGVESGHAEAPSDADVIDLGDVTILPGLIDAHVHLGFAASHDPGSLSLHRRRSRRRA